MIKTSVIFLQTFSIHSFSWEIKIKFNQGEKMRDERLQQQNFMQTFLITTIFYLYFHFSFNFPTFL